MFKRLCCLILFASFFVPDSGMLNAAARPAASGAFSGAPEQRLSIPEIGQLLTAYKTNYSGKMQITVVGSRNTMAVFRALYSSNLLKVIVGACLLCYIWSDLGAMIPTRSDCALGFVPINATMENETTLLVNQSASSLMICAQEMVCNDTPNPFAQALYQKGLDYIPWLLIIIACSAPTVILQEIRAIQPTPCITFEKDVIGLDPSIMKRIEYYISMFNNPKCFTDLGAKLPKGLLLVGPPGTGKTLIAHAIAGSTKKTFFKFPASSLASAGQVEQAFALVRKHRPAVVFFDEVEAIGGIDRDKKVGMLNLISCLSHLISCSLSLLMQMVTTMGLLLSQLLIRKRCLMRRLLDLVDLILRLKSLNLILMVA